MASRENGEAREGSAAVGSTDEISNVESSIEYEYPNSELNSSCVTILQYSEDDPIFRSEEIQRPFKRYSTFWRSYCSADAYLSYQGPFNAGGNEQLMEGRRNACMNLLNSYKNFAVNFRNSKFIYILQILLTLLPISAMVMGKKYADDCPGSPNLTGLTLFTALWSMFLIGMWVAMKCCDPENRPCEGQQKCLILFIFIFVTVLLEIEIYQFSKVSPTVDPSATRYCHKVFYDYTYYKFIGAFLSMLLVVLLYFPGCSNFASGLSCGGPGNSYYQQMLYEDD